MTPVQILDVLGQESGFTGKVIVGGPMMGIPLDNLNTPINKSTNCLIFVGEQEVKDYPRLFGELEEQACIRCTACQEACPIELQPQQLLRFSQSEEDQKLLQANLSSCVECDLCSYVCPSNIPLVQYFKEAKNRIYNKRQKEAFAEESKQRYELKAARDAEEHAKREAKRKADKLKAQERAKFVRENMAKSTGVDPVAAAKARLAAKGVTTGQTTQVNSSEQAPDNSAIMAARAARRAAREQAAKDKQATAQAQENPVQANLSSSTTEITTETTTESPISTTNTSVSNTSTTNTPTSTAKPKNAAVLAAIAKAKAAQAKAQSLGTTDPKEVAREVAKEATKEVTSEVAPEVLTEAVTKATTVTSPTTPTSRPKNTAVLAAIAKAKAAQAKAKALGTVDPKVIAKASDTEVGRESEQTQVANPQELQNHESAIPESTTQDLNSAVSSSPESGSPESKTASTSQSPTSVPARPKNVAVLAAIAKAKAAQAKAKALGITDPREVAKAEVPVLVTETNSEITSTSTKVNATKADEATETPETNDFVSTTPPPTTKTPTTPPRNSVAANAIAKAKALQAKAKALGTTDPKLIKAALSSESASTNITLNSSDNLTNSTLEVPESIAVKDKIRESADEQASVNEQPATSTLAKGPRQPVKNAAVLAAIAKAKAMQAKAQELGITNPKDLAKQQQNSDNQNS